MGDKTGISWTEASWNPTTGCTEVSEGCDHCYARQVTVRFPDAYPNGFTPTMLPGRLTIPLRWGRGRMIFVDSMSDLFHADIDDWFIAQAFAVMAATPRHTYQILTKRPGRMRSLLTSPKVYAHPAGGWMNFEDMVRHAYVTLKNGQGRFTPDEKPRGIKEILSWPKHDEFAWPLTNVWLGTSVENQKWADVRIPLLQATPAAVRFLSMEPLLGPVNLRPYLPAVEKSPDYPELVPGIDWVIVGGESGQHARPMHPDWARSLRDQCVEAGIPMWMKQLGGWPDKRDTSEAIPPDLWVRERPRV